MITTDEAILLAGGLGTRLRGIIGDVPKPLAPVAGRPFLAWVLDRLAAQRVRRVILATGNGADQVESSVGARWRGMELAYSRELEPRGTGGAIALAAKMLEGDSCFILNGDTYLALDFAAFDHDVREAGARLGVALSQVVDVSRYGAVRIEHGCVTGFVEKGKVGHGYINAGAYWMDRSVLSAFPKTGSFSFEADVLVPTVARERVTAFTATADFIDIGIPEDYRRAQALFAIAAAGS